MRQSCNPNGRATAHAWGVRQSGFAFQLWMSRSENSGTPPLLIAERPRRRVTRFAKLDANGSWWWRSSVFSRVVWRLRLARTHCSRRYHRRLSGDIVYLPALFPVHPSGRAIGVSTVKTNRIFGHQKYSQYGERHFEMVVTLMIYSYPELFQASARSGLKCPLSGGCA